MVGRLPEIETSEYPQGRDELGSSCSCAGIRPDSKFDVLIGRFLEIQPSDRAEILMRGRNNNSQQSGWCDHRNDVGVSRYPCFPEITRITDWTRGALGFSELAGDSPIGSRRNFAESM